MRTAEEASDLAALAGLIGDIKSGWRSRAECKKPGVDPSIFFPNVGGLPPSQARAVCGRCPVIAQCARFGADQDQGVWAGEFADRLRMLREENGPRWAALMRGRLVRRIGEAGGKCA